MTYFSANLPMLYSGLSLRNGLEAAARAGFDAVELWWPRGAGREALRRLAAHLRDVGLPVALLSLDSGDAKAGDRGLLSSADHLPAFRRSVSEGVEFAGVIGCARLNLLAGNRASSLAMSDQLELLHGNLAYAARAASDVGASVLLEPLNRHEYPDYLVPTVEMALSIIRSVRHPGVGLLLDVYHVARDGANIVATEKLARGHYRHIQLADVPGRGEPGIGRVPFRPLLQALEAAAYGGCCGLEYRPAQPGAEPLVLRWLRDGARGRPSYADG